MLEIRRKLPAGFKYSEIFTTAHHWWMLTQKSSWKMAVRENNLESWSHRQCHEAWALQDLRKWGLFVLNVLTASWVDALRDICALVEDVHNPSRQGSYQTLITTQVTGENRQNQVWLQEEREEGTIKNKWMLFPRWGWTTTSWACRESTSMQGRKAVVWDTTGVPWPQRVEIGVCGFALRTVGLWPGEELMGGDACVGLCQHIFYQEQLVVFLISAWERPIALFFTF